MNWYRLKSCIKCQGDLAADNGDWLCLQCGTYYYTDLYRLPSHTDDGPPVSNPPVPEQKFLGAVASPLSYATHSSARLTIVAAPIPEVADL